MRLPISKSIWISVLCLFIFCIVSPDPLFSKMLKTSNAIGGLKKIDSSKKTDIAPTHKMGLQYDAQSAVLMDGLTGQVLYEQNPQLRIPPASFVKLLTLYLAHDALRAGQLKKDEFVTVSEKAWRIQGSKMFVKVGERVTVEDLLKGITIVSGNDACIALAEHMAGSEEAFVLKMNEKANLLGLKNSQFKNSHGMPEEDQYTTATDTAILSRRYIDDHPESLSLHSTNEYEYNGIRQFNRNTLLQKNIGVDGLKTGHLEGSGYHIVATAKRDGQRMIAVVMGCDKIKRRAQEAEKLLEYGFRNFSTVEAFRKGASFGPIRVKRGKWNEITLTALGDGKVTVAKGKEHGISVMTELPKFVAAPIQKGQVVGKVLIQHEGKALKEIQLVSPSEVPKSILPSWPVLLTGLLGLVLICLIVFLWIRRIPRKKKLLISDDLFKQQNL